MEWSFVFFLNSVLLGVGLAMDAFSVSMANGLHDPKMNKGTMCKIAGTFGIFQAAMPMIGWVCVHTIVELFASFETLIPWIALALLSYIGGKMLVDGTYRRHHHCGGHLHPLHGRLAHRQKVRHTAFRQGQYSGRCHPHRHRTGDLHHRSVLNIKSPECLWTLWAFACDGYPFIITSVKKRNGKIRVCAAMKAPVGLLSGRAVCAADGGTLSRQAPQIFPFRK